MLQQEQNHEAGIDQTAREIVQRRRQERLNEQEGILFKTGFVYEEMLAARSLDQSWPLKMRNHDWSEAKRHKFCHSAIREFATVPRTSDRTSESSTILVQFGEVGLRAIFDAVYDHDDEVRLLSICCVSHLLLTHLTDYIVEVADLLSHWDLRVALYVPRMLWRLGDTAVFIIPKLEECYKHEDTTLAALSAKSVSIIDPSKTERSRSNTCINSVDD